MLIFISYKGKHRQLKAIRPCRVLLNRLMKLHAFSKTMFYYVKKKNMTEINKL